MANTNNVSISNTAAVNGLTVGDSATTTTTPVGSIALAESVFVQTASYQQVYLSGSNATPIGTISIFGSNPIGTGSVSVVASGSGFASFLGNISGSQATSIAWNAPLNALYAQSYSTASYVNFIVITQ